MMIPRTYVLPILFLLFFIILIRGVSTVRILDLKVPSYVPTNSSVLLECLYDLENEQLYSVKWSKNENEFFRFVPSDEAVIQAFPRPGLLIDLRKSSDTAVTVKLLNWEASGKYKCEVNAQAPSFRSASQFKNVLVFDIPEIEVTRSRYAPGDIIRVNCSSLSLKPDVNLTWFINGDPVDDSYLKIYTIEVRDNVGFEIKRGLEFKVQVKHFRRGGIKLKCVAVIAQLYTRINEVSLAVIAQLSTRINEVRAVASSSSALGPVLSAAVLLIELYFWKGYMSTLQFVKSIQWNRHYN